MREIITLAVGQCGNQINHKFWETISKEHGINPLNGQYEGNDVQQIEKSDVYFNEVPGGRFVPRALLVDLEPGVLNSVASSGAIKGFFNPDNFISA